MDRRQTIRKMIEFQKSVLDNTFNTISAVQDQSARMFIAFLNKAKWLPADGKKVINDWVSEYRKGRDDFKMILDEKYEEAANYIRRQENTGPFGMKD